MFSELFVPTLNDTVTHSFTGKLSNEQMVPNASSTGFQASHTQQKTARHCD